MSKQQEQTELGSPAKVALTGLAALFMTLVAITMPLTKNAEGAFDYVPSSAVLLAEVVKLAIAFSLVVRGVGTSDVLGALMRRVRERDARTEFALYAVPSLLYFILNNVALIIQRAISPVSFQLISQLKTVLTGVLVVALLGRRLTPHQWLALAILSCATASAIDSSGSSRSDVHDSQRSASPELLDGSHGSSSPALGGDREGGGGALHARYSLPATLGVLLTVLSSFLSSFAGVFNEMLLKSRQTCASPKRLTHITL